MITLAEMGIKFILLRQESNLRNHIRWLTFLASPEFASQWQKTFGTRVHMQELVNSAKQVVEEDIYAYNTTSGTGRIKRSFVGKYMEADNGISAVVYSDPSVAPAKGPFSSGEPSDFSYAAFFEDERFNSFIPPKEEPRNIRRYRPFFGAMTAAQHQVSKALTLQHTLRRVRLRMPKSQE